MNILLLNVTLGNDSAFGGIESHSDILASFLAGRGHHVVIGCRIDGSLLFKSQNVRVPARKVRIINSGDLRAIFQICRICRQEKIGVIIANHGREYWPASVSAILLGLRIFFIRHQVDRVRRTTRWLIARHVDGVIAVSEAVRQALLRSGIPSGKIQVIHNSIALAEFEPAKIRREDVRTEFGFRPGDIVVGTVAKLHHGKGVFELLRAISLLADDRIKLLFVGDGPDRTALERDARKLAIAERVVFAGIRRDMDRVYASIDIFILASTCEEAFGMVVIEAMSMEKPVIATKVGGIPEIIQDGINGVLVPPYDVPALAHAISRYIDDGNFSREMGLEGRKTVENKFSGQIMGRQFESLLGAE